MTGQNKKDEIKATIARLRSHNEAKLQAPSQPPSHDKGEVQERKRASSRTEKTSTENRKWVINGLIKQLLLGEITQGAALKQFRIKVLGLKQDAYALLVSVSRKTLSDVENDKGNYSVEVINRIFKPFGLQIGLVPIAKNQLQQLLSSGA